MNKHWSKFIKKSEIVYIIHDNELYKLSKGNIIYKLSCVNHEAGNTFSYWKQLSGKDISKLKVSVFELPSAQNIEFKITDIL